MIRYRVIDQRQAGVGNIPDQITGQGLDFPLSIDITGDYTLSSGIERIRDSILQILLTRIGERPFNPEFGSRLPDLVFEPFDPLFETILIKYTKDAISRWEPRVVLKEVELLPDQDNNQMLIRLRYQIKNAPVEDVFTIPFQKEPIPSDELYTGSERVNMLNQGEIR